MLHDYDLFTLFCDVCIIGFGNPMGCGYGWVEGLYEQIWRIEGRYCDEGEVLLPPFFSFFNFEYGIHEEENRRIRIQALYFNLCDKSRNMKTVKIVLLVTAFYVMWIV